MNRINDLGNCSNESAPSIIQVSAPDDCLLNIAKQYAASGVSVLPISNDGTRKPALPEWKPFQKRLATVDELHTWFGHGATRGIALVGGEISGGLEILDFDEPPLLKPWEEAVKAANRKELLSKLVCVQTPSGGWHLMYRCPGHIDGNLKLARRKNSEGTIDTLIETRGEGGYVLTVGTAAKCHPKGKPYVLIRGNLLNIPVITPEERDVLISCARSFNEYVPENQNHYTKHKTTNDGARPGDDFNLKAAWKDILEPHGWTRVRQIGHTVYWRKPGATNPGHHATTNHAENDLLFVFSTSAAPFESEKAYAKFSAYTLLEHNGDFGKAAKTLAANGYAAPYPNKTGKSTEVNTEPPDWSKTDVFGEPMLFGNIETPEITSEFLPKWVRDYVDALAAHTQTPVGVAAMLALSVLGACLQKRFKVAPYGSEDGYVEPLNIWILAALPPASRKTALLAALRAPIIQWEQEESKRLKPEIERQRAERSVIAERIKVLTSQAGKAEE